MTAKRRHRPSSRHQAVAQKGQVMTRLTIPCVTGILLAGTVFALNRQPPAMPKPEKEHAFLEQFVGEWEGSGEMTPAPGAPAITCKMSDKVRLLGGFWMVSDGKGEMAGMKMENVLTLGYDPVKKQYIGQWVDSMMPHQWNYVGEVDGSGKKITLHTEGPNPEKPGKLFKFRETFEFADKDRRIFTSSMQQEDGAWKQIVKVEAMRKK